MSTSIGRRRAETPSMNGDAEADYVLAEQELGKLRREYRILKNQRKAYLEESQNIIRKQNAYIDSLKGERSEMWTDLKLATSGRVCQKDSINEGLMKTLLQNYLEYNNLCTNEKDDIKDVDKQRRVLDEAVRQYNIITTRCTDDQKRVKMMTIKRTRVMENRLYLSTVTFNKALRKNSHLRERIEELRRERRLYDVLYRKMCVDQNDLKTDMNSIIHLSTTAYDSRDEAYNKIAALRERMEKDQNAFNVEVKSLQRIVDHEDKLKAFMNLKAHDRADQLKITADEIQLRKQNHGQTDTSDTHPNLLEQSFIRLRAATGESDLDKLVHRFICREGINFALFNFVNEVNDDTEQLQEEIKKKEGDMKSFRSQGTRLEGERLNIMKGLETKGNGITNEADQNETGLKRVRKRLNRIMSAVMNTVHRLGCDKTQVTRRLGSRDGISEVDALGYLGLIELATNELMLFDKCNLHKKTVSATAAKKDDKQGGGAPDGGQAKPSNSVVMAVRQPAPPTGVTIVPPTIREEFDIMENSSSAEVLNSGDQPLTLEQVKGRVTRRLQRLESVQRGKTSGKTTPNPASPSKAPQDATKEGGTPAASS